MHNDRHSIKHQDIEKINTRMLVSVAVAAFVIIFSIIASRSLISELQYQDRVATAKQQALTSLKNDVNSANALIASYRDFVDKPQNLIGGSSSFGSGVNSGNNAQIVLDALPSTYDYPALVTSLNNLINSVPGITTHPVAIAASTGATTTPSSGSTAAPTPLAFSVSAQGSLQSIQALLSTLHNCIMPLQILNMQLSAATNNSMSMSASLETFYQPGVAFQISTQVVK